MGLESPSNGELLTNSIAFFIPSLIIFILRMTNSIWIKHKFDWSDITICFAFFFYICMLVFVNVSANFETNLFPPKLLDSILADPDDVQNRVIGSKIVIPLEQCMLAAIWCGKLSLLFFMYPLTNQLPRTRRILICIFVYVVSTWCAIELAYFGFLCHPFSQYWAVPVQNPECATYSTYSKVQMAFNISSDLMIAIFPFTIFYRSQLPLKRKLLLIAVFSLGYFCIIAAILNKYYNFASPLTTVYALWYIREGSISIWVCNLVCCWQIFQTIFSLRSFDDRHSAPGRGALHQRQQHFDAATNHSVGGHTTNSTWWSRMVARGVQLAAEERAKIQLQKSDVGDAGIELGRASRGNGGGSLFSVSVDDVILPSFEHRDYYSAESIPLPVPEPASPAVLHG